MNDDGRDGGNNDQADSGAGRVRRQPPPFRRLGVVATEQLTPHLRRIVIGGPELEGLEITSPAASVRLLIPSPGETPIVLPFWTGNQFEHGDGRRAPIRTFTPRHLDRQRLELTLDVVLHDRGAASDWARSVAVGDEAAISGPGRGYEFDPGVGSYLVAGDETAIPAIGQLLETLPATAEITVHIEIAAADARLDLPHHPKAAIEWHVARPGDAPGAAFAAAVELVSPLPDAIWVAGEAAAVQRLRKHLFDERGVDRAAVSAHGYWKHGRSAT